MTTHGKLKHLVDAHFDGSITSVEEREMRAHLETCETCRSRYRRHLLLSKLDPEAKSAEDRIAKALEIPEQNAVESDRLRFLWPVGGALAMAAALILLMRSPDGDAFVPRGSGDVDAKAQEAARAGYLHVYRETKGTGPERATPIVDAIRRDDSLIFGIENRDAKHYVMIFGVDDRGEIYWFYPAWTNPNEDPSAVRLSAAPSLQMLPDAVTQHIGGEKLALHALFLDDRKTVKQIESLVKQAPSAIEGDHVMTYEIAP